MSTYSTHHRVTGSGHLLNGWLGGYCRCNLPWVPWPTSYDPKLLNTVGSLQQQTAGESYIRYQETTQLLSYLAFMPKLGTHRMHDPGSFVPYIRPKVITDNQMSRIKYNSYINNISKDYDDSQAKRNSGRLHNATGMATGATHSLELLIKEFQSIFSF
jgi:hypothetical protein